ncbi:MAG: hypothetical protein H7836_08215 [Magnetococcus sp. YQC-3]
MQFKTHNNKDIDVNSSSLKGYIIYTYSKLVELFGKPRDCTGGYKTDAEWYIEWEDGVVSTIYNYKTGKNYLGDEGLEVEEIMDWHVGGYNGNSYKYIVNFLNLGYEDDQFSRSF